MPPGSLSTLFGTAPSPNARCKPVLNRSTNSTRVIASRAFVVTEEIAAATTVITQYTRIPTQNGTPDSGAIRLSAIKSEPPVEVAPNGPVQTEPARCSVMPFATALITWASINDFTVAMVPAISAPRTSVAAAAFEEHKLRTRIRRNSPHPCALGSLACPRSPSAHVGFAHSVAAPGGCRRDPCDMNSAPTMNPHEARAAAA